MATVVKPHFQTEYPKNVLSLTFEALNMTWPLLSNLTFKQSILKMYCHWHMRPWTWHGHCCQTSYSNKVLSKEYVSEMLFWVHISFNSLRPSNRYMHHQQNSVKLYSEFKHFHSWKCMWKCCLENVGNSVSASMCYSDLFICCSVINSTSSLFCP